jgi:hypothetical protein
VLGAVVAVITEAGARPQQQVARALQPSCATTNAALQDTNMLHEMDTAAQVGAWAAGRGRCWAGPGQAGPIQRCCPA